MLREKDVSQERKFRNEVEIAYGMRIISELDGNVDGGYSPTERQGAKAIKIYVRRSALSAFMYT